MICLDIQSIIKNYASYVINWIRPLAIRQNLESAIACALVRAPSHKLQASSPKLPKVQATSVKPQATSVKPQATSVKLEATSIKLTDHGPWKKFQAS